MAAAVLKVFDKTHSFESAAQQAERCKSPEEMNQVVESR